jgi:hypothetical protein
MAIFTPNPRFLKELTEEPDYAEGLKKAAGPAASKAESFAHHAMPRPGRRRVEVVEADGKVYISNTNYGAHLEEFGTAHSPVYAPLRRGARAAGLTLKEASK